MEGFVDHVLGLLAQLRGAGQIAIPGYGTADVLVNIKCDRCFSGAETKKQVEGYCQQGDQAFAHDSPNLAVECYKAALRTRHASSVESGGVCRTINRSGTY